MSNSIEIQKNDGKWLTIITILGIAIPVVVAVLLFLPQTGKLGDLDFSFLPHLNAVLNTATAFALAVGYYFIKSGQRNAHRSSMLIAFGLGSIFLVSYVLYHFQVAATKFGDLNHDHLISDAEASAAGGLRILYYIILFSHIILAATIVPLVLLSIYYGLSRQFEKHTRISTWTFPLWLYVSVTGVIVYLMISPYYLN
ncbi:MAG: DUF420 domain-containing protein [Bacteroidota bacterium]